MKAGNNIELFMFAGRKVWALNIEVARTNFAALRLQLSCPSSQEKKLLTELRSSRLPFCSSEFFHLMNVLSWMISSSMKTSRNISSRSVKRSDQHQGGKDQSILKYHQGTETRTIWVLHADHQTPHHVQGLQLLLLALQEGLQQGRPPEHAAAVDVGNVT